LVREGKICHIGVSNYDADQMRALGRYGRVETLQPPYHLFRRDIEDTILPYATEQDMGVLVYGPMAHARANRQLARNLVGLRTRAHRCRRRVPASR
jgi:aryl-alcohol dehydrogenase-like predicted oxidoreductase